VSFFFPCSKSYLYFFLLRFFCLNLPLFLELLSLNFAQQVATVPPVPLLFVLATPSPPHRFLQLFPNFFPHICVCIHTPPLPSCGLTHRGFTIPFLPEYLLSELLVFALSLEKRAPFVPLCDYSPFFSKTPPIGCSEIHSDSSTVTEGHYSLLILSPFLFL